MEHTIATSADGSNTLQLTRFNETYHSRNGAYTEATHIYIKCGLEYLFEKGLERDSGTSAGNTCPTAGTPANTAPASGINIFDVGLGTALNCILAWCWQQQQIRAGKPYPQIAYYGIEKYPIQPHEALLMNYPQIIAEHLENLPDKNNNTHGSFIKSLLKPENTPRKYRSLSTEEITSAFEKIHTCEWGRNIEITPGFILQKNHADITELKHEYFKGCEYEGKPSAIFYDTFSPATQPELWDEKIFRTIADGCARGSVLTTYCSKGSVKQALRNAGYTLERLSGPPGKRHILRGILCEKGTV